MTPIAITFISNGKTPILNSQYRLPASGSDSSSSTQQTPSSSLPQSDTIQTQGGTIGRDPSNQNRNSPNRSANSSNSSE